MNRFSLAVAAYIGILLTMPVPGLLLSTSKVVAQEISPELSVTDLQKVAQSVTVKVLSKNSGGSGILIAKQGQSYMVLTNAHVLTAGQPYRIQTSDGKIHNATQVRQESFAGNDLALLRFVASNNYAIAKLGTISSANLNNQVLAAGFPYESKGLQLRMGRIKLISDKALRGGYQIAYTNEITQGMSGGPLLNSQGEVIGINGLAAYPILNRAYVFQDGTQPNSQQQQQMRQFSWGVPMQTAAQLAPQYIALKNPETTPTSGNNQQVSPLTGVLKEVNDIARQITVIISTPNSNGSGIIIAHRDNTYYVLTAYHVVREQEEYKLTAPDGKQYFFDNNTIVRQPGVDLAVVQFRSESTYRVATISSSRVADNQYVFAAGYPPLNKTNPSWRFSPGRIFSKEQGLMQVKNFVIDNQGSSTAQSASSLKNGYELVYSNITYGGMSGGPVLDTQGRLIGIHGQAEAETVIDDEFENFQLGYSLGIPASTFLSLTNKLNLNTQWLQVETSPAAKLYGEQENSINQALLSVDVPKKDSPASVWIERGNQLWRLRQYQEAVAAFDEAIKRKPAFVHLAWYGKGLALFELNQYKSAADAFEQAISNKPKFYIALKMQSAVLTKLKQLEPALAAIEKAIQIQPNDANLYIQKGYVLGELKRYSEGIAAYKQGIDLIPRAVFYNNRGNLYSNQKKWDLALADYNTAIKLNPEFAYAYTARGSLYDDQKKWDLALADYNTAIKLNPEFTYAYNNRGVLYSNQKKWDLALADYNTAIKLNPELADAYNNRGGLYYNQKKWDLALADFNSAIKLNPEYAGAYYNWGLLYSYQKKWDLALADFNSAIKLNPDHALAYNNRGGLYYNQKKWDLALADYNSAIKLNPEYAGAYNNRGLLYSYQKKWDLALADYNSAIKLNPEFADAYNNRGVLYYNQKKWDLALADYNTAIKLNPDDADAYNNRGNLYSDQKKWDLALADYNTAIKLNPEYADAYNNRGLLYYRQKKWDLAIRDFNQVQTIRPESAGVVIYLIGIIKYEMGATDSASQQWQQVVNQYPEPQLALAVAFYTQGETEKAFQLADAALRSNKDLADVAYLKDKFWGDRLIADTQKFYSTPRMQALLSQMQALSGAGNK